MRSDLRRRKPAPGRAAGDSGEPMPFRVSRAPGASTAADHRPRRGGRGVSLSLIAALCAVPLAAQRPSPFRPLELPTPNAARSASGAPGPLYWQQRADYRIEATLDPVANRLTGRETITYVNHSPHSLPWLWL